MSSGDTKLDELIPTRFVQGTHTGVLSDIPLLAQYCAIAVMGCRVS